jgi:hypothetical protein
MRVGVAGLLAPLHLAELFAQVELIVVVASIGRKQLLKGLNEILYGVGPMIELRAEISF